ncbi:DUF1772 domain-containing protein [Asanoa sp. WMMD1127]|uniref:anthrone oxygenase family protein n=1 Tax=Asanoa sp. WMMD1127 TaxID=3016107 RepID=UPI002415D202|nr:anthrone oxygenase family protein [Asanoa sp. WMMD1127]MDG4820765.1 DUF1772 domain-containing protein [Asanoa sp. WMMD1127]
MDRVLAVVALLGSGVVTGVLFAVALSMVPALMAMTPDRYIHAHKLLGRNWDPTMPIIVIGATLADLAWAVSAGTAATRATALTAAVLLVGVSVVSHLANVPINKRMRAVDADAIPADWSDPRPVWRSWHLLRTSLAAAAFAANCLAATWV